MSGNPSESLPFTVEHDGDAVRFVFQQPRRPRSIKDFLPRALVITLHISLILWGVINTDGYPWAKAAIILTMPLILFLFLFSRSKKYTLTIDSQWITTQHNDRWSKKTQRRRIDAVHAIMLEPLISPEEARSYSMEVSASKMARILGASIQSPGEKDLFLIGFTFGEDQEHYDLIAEELLKRSPDIDIIYAENLWIDRSPDDEPSWLDHPNPKTKVQVQRLPDNDFCLSFKSSLTPKANQRVKVSAIVLMALGIGLMFVMPAEFIALPLGVVIVLLIVQVLAIQFKPKKMAHIRYEQGELHLYHPGFFSPPTSATFAAEDITAVTIVKLRLDNQALQITAAGQDHRFFTLHRLGDHDGEWIANVLREALGLEGAEVL